MRRCMLIVLLAFTAPASAADWYNWRGPFHNGVSPETNLPEKWSLDGENLIWKAPYGCRSTPLILNGRVYFINYAGVADPAENAHFSRLISRVKVALGGEPLRV